MAIEQMNIAGVMPAAHSRASRAVEPVRSSPRAAASAKALVSSSRWLYHHSAASAWKAGQCRLRGLRGGAYDSPAKAVRSTSRFRYDTDVRYPANGFRVVRELQ